MYTFCGTFYHSLDQKNRIRIPARLKQSISGNVVIAKSAGGFLSIYPSETIEEIFSNIKAQPVKTLQEERALRAFEANMFYIEEDTQGRFTLMSKLREHANIEKEVAFVGRGDRIELWSKENWLAYEEEMAKEASDPMLLSRFGI